MSLGLPSVLGHRMACMIYDRQLPKQEKGEQQVKFTKDGKEYADIEQAYFAHCGIMAHCKICGMNDVTGRNKSCREFARKNPLAAAKLMGFQVR